MKKSHLVFVPCPAMGHLVPAVINHREHLSIIALLIGAPFDPNLEAFIHSLSSSLYSFPKRLRFIPLPPFPDPTNSLALHPSSFVDAIIEYQKLNVRDAVSKLNSDPDSPRLAGFVVDVFCTTMIDVATEFEVPTMVFFTSGAAFLGFKHHIHTLLERDNVDTTAFNFKDSGTEFAIPSFENLVPASVFPNIVLDKEWERLLFNQASSMKNKAKGIIVNTFEELESYAVKSY